MKRHRASQAEGYGEVNELSNLQRKYQSANELAQLYSDASGWLTIPCLPEKITQQIT
jgi:hypothetical protein